MHVATVCDMLLLLLLLLLLPLLPANSCLSYGRVSPQLYPGWLNNTGLRF